MGERVKYFLQVVAYLIIKGWKLWLVLCLILVVALWLRGCRDERVGGVGGLQTYAEFRVGRHLTFDDTLRRLHREDGIHSDTAADADDRVNEVSGVFGVLCRELRELVNHYDEIGERLHVSVGFLICLICRD